MDAFDGLIKRIVTSFNAAGLDYMFTGALASSFYGVARTTVDIDVVVRVSWKTQRAKLLTALKQGGLGVNAKRIDSTLKSGYRIVTLSDHDSPYNVDVIFSSAKTLNKRAGTIAGMPTFYQTPEDLILAKLRMIKATVPRERALKDEEDVKAILRFTKVDLKAVGRQARNNGTLLILESVTA